MKSNISLFWSLSWMQYNEGVGLDLILVSTKEPTAGFLHLSLDFWVLHLIRSRGRAPLLPLAPQVILGPSLLLPSPL